MEAITNVKIGVLLMLRKNCEKISACMGFTLAEVLITLAVIGIVAALTIPTLLSKNEERIRETQLKKAYTVLAQSHQMMLVHDILPYEEFVKPFKDLEQDGEDPSNPDNSGGSEQPDVPTEPENPDKPQPPDETEEPTVPSTPDMNDKRTKELVDGLIEAVFKGDWDTVVNNFNELKDMYGLFNLKEFLEDYFEQSQSGKSKFKIGYANLKYFYMPMLADVSGTGTEDETGDEFIKVKKYQLQVLKSLLNGAQYCKGYDTCYSETEPVHYTNLNGSAAKIEAAEFENSALKTSDGMYIWLGDINNPQRYFVDINGVKRPNKLGVDVFTFDITPKEAISPEMNANCTKTGSPVEGEESRGLGCTGYAILDQSPDVDKQRYWNNFK